MGESNRTAASAIEAQFPGRPREGVRLQEWCWKVGGHWVAVFIGAAFLAAQVGFESSWWFLVMFGLPVAGFQLYGSYSLWIWWLEARDTMKEGMASDRFLHLNRICRRSLLALFLSTWGALGIVAGHRGGERPK